MMTAARDFVGDEESVAFSLPRNRPGVRRVRIGLEPAETYTVEFFDEKGVVMAEKTARGVHFDEIRALFIKATGVLI